MFYVTCNMEKRNPDTPKENKTKELVCEVSGLMMLKKKNLHSNNLYKFCGIYLNNKKMAKTSFFLSFSLN